MRYSRKSELRLDWRMDWTCSLTSIEHTVCSTMHTYIQYRWDVCWTYGEWCCSSVWAGWLDRLGSVWLLSLSCSLQWWPSSPPCPCQQYVPMVRLKEVEHTISYQGALDQSLVSWLFRCRLLWYIFSTKFHVLKRSESTYVIHCICWYTQCGQTHYGRPLTVDNRPML